MSIYRVTYRSLTAFYGPKFIEADSAAEAKRKFAKGAFSQDEMVLIEAKPATVNDVLCHAREQQ
jgi:hypothetical protein